MKNKGITLIALIITIIIMLILAGIVISLTIGENGIIAKAQLAGRNYLDAQNREETDLAKLANEIGTYNLASSRNENCNFISKDIEDFIPVIDFVNGTYIEVSVPEITTLNSVNIVGYAFLIDGKVKQYSTDKKFTFENLELNTSYTFEIIAMDENGKIKWSKDKKQSTENVLFLYKNGNEATPVTNGWTGTSIAGYGTSYGQYNKGKDFLYVKNTSTESSGNSNYWPSWVTNKQINLSGFSKIIFEGDFKAPSNSSCVPVVSTNQTSFQSGVYHMGDAYLIGSNSTRLKFSLADVNKSNNYYVSMSALNSNYNDHSEVTIRKIWLEK